MSWWRTARCPAPKLRASGYSQKRRSTVGWRRVCSRPRSPMRRRRRSSVAATIRSWNGRCARAAGLHDAVVIAVARREQGLVVAAGNPLQLSDVAGVAAKRARLALRPQGAGAQLLLLALVARAGLALDALALVRPVCPTGADIAQAVRAGRADCRIATRAVAQAAGLDL